jgi:hypothetical protein
MSTPARALNVARLAAWGAIAIAGGYAAGLIGTIARVGLAPLLGFVRAELDLSVLVLAAVAGALAYLRPALWSIALALAVIALDAVYQLVEHGLSFNVFFDVLLFGLAINSFRGLRRYRELAAAAHTESAFG